MHWISVKDGLPEDGQAVLVRYKGDNWWSDHKLADGSLHKQWRWQAARFVRGRTAEEVARDNVISIADQHGNNRVPYCWDEFGPGRLFGQDVTHWAAITDPLVATNRRINRRGTRPVE